MDTGRVIFHVDMDAFYASVEQLDHPEYRGRPVVVGASPGKRGVVSAASYEARKFGIHSAMPIGEAFRRCPRAVFLPVRMQRYKEMSDRVFEIFFDFTPMIQPVSVDEAFLDMTGCCHLRGGVRQSAAALKHEIRAHTRLTASIGVAPTRLVAKIASDLEKPDGLTLVSPEKMQGFLDVLAVGKLWGVGPKTVSTLKGLGIQTVGDLRRMPGEVLERKLGRDAKWIHDLSMGIDPSPVSEPEIPKSVSRETTFEKDTRDMEQIRHCLLDMASDVGRRLRRMGMKARTVEFTYRGSDFHRKSRRKTLAIATDQDMDLFLTVWELLIREIPSGRRFRLVGVGTGNFVGDGAGIPDQADLFDRDESQKKGRVLHAMDEIRDKWGNRSIRSGLLVGKRQGKGRKDNQ